jgi:hypothetical protein
MAIDPVLIPAIMSLFFQGLIGVISQIQHSRCTEIRGCGFNCKRKVPEEDKEEETKPLVKPTTTPVEIPATQQPQNIDVVSPKIVNHL